jgi:hypothetical protein
MAAVIGSSTVSRVPARGRAVELDAAAERLDAVLDPQQAGAAARDSTSGTVVTDRDAQHVASHLDVDADSRGRARAWPRW